MDRGRPKRIYRDEPLECRVPAKKSPEEPPIPPPERGKPVRTA